MTTLEELTETVKKQQAEIEDLKARVVKIETKLKSEDDKKHAKKKAERGGR